MLVPQVHEHSGQIADCVQTQAAKMIRDMWQADKRANALKAYDLFIETFEKNIRRQRNVLKKTRKICSAFMIIRRNIGLTLERRIRLNRHLQQSGCATSQQKETALPLLPLQWLSSFVFRQRKTGDGSGDLNNLNLSPKI